MLRSLEAGHPRLTPEAALRADVHAMAAEPLTAAEFARLLAEAEGKGWILGVHDELDGTRKWRLTDKGRAILLERA
jgi:hypothetical protein